MTLLEQIKEFYPDIDDVVFANGTILLQNDSDGLGDYIAQWNYDKPIPENLKLGK